MERRAAGSSGGSPSPTTCALDATLPHILQTIHSDLVPHLPTLGSSPTPYDPQLTPLGSGILNLLARLANPAVLGAGNTNDNAGVDYWEKNVQQINYLIGRASALIQLARDKLHAYPYREVPVCWRRLYGDASVLKAVFQFTLLRVEFERNTRSTGGPGRKRKWEVFEKEGGRDGRGFEGDGDSDSRSDPWPDTPPIHTLDMALIMSGAPGPSRRSLIELLLHQTHQICSSLLPPSPSLPKPALSPPPATLAPIITSPLRIFPTPPSLTTFLTSLSHPFIIKSLNPHWPALTTRPWSSPAYLLSHTNSGKRLVPIELGKSYTDASWGQKILPFKQFLDEYILHPSPSSSTGYLAQHDLFSQIPALRSDIAVPDYCYSYTDKGESEGSDGEGDTTEPLLNAWFGPPNTLSPLHTDPYKNILCQVVGKKYIRLYNPHTETPRLFPRGVEAGGVDMSNTSGVEVGWVEGDEFTCDEEDGTEEQDGGDGKDERREKKRKMWEEFKKAEYVEGILEPGDGLFIPVGWWHYVRSLDVSFSVSFWWK